MKLGRHVYTLTPEERATFARIYEDIKNNPAKAKGRTDDHILNCVMAMVMELVFAKVNDFEWIEDVGPYAHEVFAWDVRDHDGRTYDLKRQHPAWWAVDPEDIRTLCRKKDEVDYVVTGTMRRIEADTFEVNFIRVIETASLFRGMDLNDDVWFESKFRHGEYVFNHKSAIARDFIVEEAA